MDKLAEIFETNRVIVYSTYGQVFFLLGVAVLLRSRKHSQLALARSIWWLGVFGVLHGLSEWAYVFIPIQAEYLPRSIVGTLWLAHTLVEAASFACLFEFGIMLTRPSRRRHGLRLIPAAVLLLWLLVYSVLYFGLGLSGRTLYITVDVLGRYLLAVPGALLVAVGLLREVDTVHAVELPRIARYLRWAAASFVAYAVLAGLFVPAAGFFPASVLNSRLLTTFVGVPVPVFRSLCGLVIAYCIVRAMKVFDVEMDRLIAHVEHNETIAAERERISRELHDGTIQSLYASGLALEDAAYSIGRDNAVAKDKVRHVMLSLNRTIGDVRKYILDLHSSLDNRQFEQQLRTLAYSVADHSGLKAKMYVTANRSRPVVHENAAELLQVAREAFANVSRHAKASHIDVLLHYGKESVTLRIDDDGCGFDPKLSGQDLDRGQGQGLRNMARRVEWLGGTFRVDTAPGKGTRIEAELAYAGKAIEQAAHIAS